MDLSPRARYALIIDGQQVEAASGETFTVINPATNEALATFAKGGPEDVDRAVDAARRAMEGKWGRLRPADRTRLLYRLAAAMADHAADLARLETLNVGKAISSTYAEVYSAIEELEFFAGLARAAGEAFPLAGSLQVMTQRDPVGVCALIVPWNYPIMLTGWKLAPALAAGNAVVVKPASATPITALMLAELALEVGFPPGVINVVTGPGSTVGDALVTHPGVAKISFTGETETGKNIMRKAAGDLKRVSLELGGKSPNLVFEDVDIEATAAASVWAIFYSAGQSCEARSRLFVHKSIYDRFLDAFVSATRRLVVGDPLDRNTHVGALISPQQVERVDGYVKLALEEGGRVLAGGSRPDDAALARGNFYLPTVIEGLGNHSRVCQEEIFGPVVAVQPFADEDEAVRLANDTQFGLAATVFTRDAARALRVARSIKAGTVTVNTPFTSFAGVPFGGFKASGFGRERALETLHLYTETRSVIINTGKGPHNPFGL
ncbi:MAG: aldehyde dehydrogenase family protein [Thermaerobacter sp.]|nr:betaine-aldehyde dehydrogenase [Bacillota bacterium]